MTRFSPEFKEQMVRKMLPPNRQSVASISRESGIPTPGLYAWKREFRERGCVVPELLHRRFSRLPGYDNPMTGTTHVDSRRAREGRVVRAAGLAAASPTTGNFTKLARG